MPGFEIVLLQEAAARPPIEGRRVS